MYDVDAAGKARNFRCKFCIMFADKIKHLPNYSGMYVKASTNYRVSAVKGHAKNGGGDPQPPNTAYGNFLKANGIEIEQHTNNIAKSCDKANTAIVCKLQIDKKMDPSTLTITKTSSRQHISWSSKSYPSVNARKYKNWKVNMGLKLVRNTLRFHRCILSQTLWGNSDVIVQIVDCKGWKSDTKFADDAIIPVYDKFEVPLKSGGLSANVPNVLICNGMRSSILLLKR